MHHTIRTYARAAFALSTAFLSIPAWGISDYSSVPQPDPVTGLSTGTSYTSAPTLTSANGALIPSSAAAGGWNYEGLFTSNYTATPIGPQWIATVSHIGSSSTFFYNGTTYNVVPNSGVIINPASDGSGIELYRISGTFPTYAKVWTTGDGASEIHAQAVITGRGYDEGAAINALNTPGDPYQTGQSEGFYPGANNSTLRWGENYVYPESGSTSYLAFSFDSPNTKNEVPNQSDYTPNEAGLYTGDSGGGLYLYSTVNQQWELAGLNEGFPNGDGPYSTSSNFANSFTASLYDTQGLYTAPGQEVTSYSIIGGYNTPNPGGGTKFNEVDTVGTIAVAYDLSSQSAAIAATQDFINTTNYTLSLGANTLTFNSSNSSTTLGVISGNNAISSNVLFANNFVFTVPAGSTFTFSGSASFNRGFTLGSNGPGILQWNNLRTTGLTITNGTVKIVPSGTESSVSIFNSLSISAGGKLDLTNNDLIINSTGSDLTSTIRSYLVSGYDQGRWDLSGIVSSMAGSSGPLMTLGYADNSLLGLSSFDGFIVTSSSVLVKYTYVGDANLDGVVNGADLAMMSATGTSWMQGDFNYDGVVNADDYALFMLGIAGQGSAIHPAPEPAGAMVIAGSIALALIRRRR
jgi:hypothetical protein